MTEPVAGHRDKPEDCIWRNGQLVEALSFGPVA